MSSKMGNSYCCYVCNRAIGTEILFRAHINTKDHKREQDRQVLIAEAERPGMGHLHILDYFD